MKIIISKCTIVGLFGCCCFFLLLFLLIILTLLLLIIQLLKSLKRASLQFKFIIYQKACVNKRVKKVLAGPLK